MVDFFARYARTCFVTCTGLVKILVDLQRNQHHAAQPVLSGAMVFEEGENEDQVKHCAAHHELVASALATKIAHEVNPENQVGCMLAGGTFTRTPASQKTCGWRWKKTARTCSLSTYSPWSLPGLLARVFREKGVEIVKDPGDDALLKNTVDFVSFSYYASCCAGDMNAGNTSGEYREVTA